jgi:hypothetical protein
MSSSRLLIRLANDNQPFLKTIEAAELLAVGPDKIIDLIGDGSLVAINIARHSGGIRPRWRISREALERFIVSRQPTAAPATARKKRQQAVTSTTSPKIPGSYVAAWAAGRANEADCRTNP